MGHGEGWQPPDPEALVLPGQHVVGQVDFLMDHRELDLWVLAGHHLTGSDGEERKIRFFKLRNQNNRDL